MQTTFAKKSKAAPAVPLPIASLEVLLHVFHQLSEAVNQALTNLRANYTHQSTTHKHKELQLRNLPKRSLPIRFWTCTAKKCVSPEHDGRVQHHKKELINGLSRPKNWKKHALHWRNHLLELLRLQHNEAHERSTQGPLVLAILKHDAFEQLQHDSWQCAENRSVAI